MKSFVLVRVLLVLRRIAVALESANELEQYRQSMEFRPLKETDTPPARHAIISKPSINRWNDRHAGIPDETSGP